jgi:hypothetical protein
LTLDLVNTTSLIVYYCKAKSCQQFFEKSETAELARIARNSAMGLKMGKDLD